MIEMLYGFAGAVIAILVFVGGVAFGYHIACVKKPKPVDPVEAEQKKVAEANAAFADLMSYDINRAYGMESDGP